jgi:Aspartyl/Asparaginyl beta-hydroxylase
MNHLRMTDLTFNVEPLHAQLRRNPQIWNQIPYRTQFAWSPHREVDDIWVRYNALENFTGDGPAFNSEHRSVWYPVISQIPEAKLLALELFSLVAGERLGGVLITRVPAGKQVYPHTDPGWHARYYEKFIIQVTGNDRQRFCFKDEELVAQPGQCYWFDNQFEHWVVNDSDEDRISLIVCLRRETCH